MPAAPHWALPLRVFKIDRDTGVRAYLDPWSESWNGRLRFETQYKVTTGH